MDYIEQEIRAVLCKYFGDVGDKTVPIDNESFNRLVRDLVTILKIK